jgi:hypothetical protein
MQVGDKATHPHPPMYDHDVVVVVVVVVVGSSLYTPLPFTLTLTLTFNERGELYLISGVCHSELCVAITLYRHHRFVV